MNTENATKLLIEAIELAQRRGAYTLKEAATINAALESLTTNTNNNMENENEPVVDTIDTTAEQAPAIEGVPAQGSTLGAEETASGTAEAPAEAEAVSE